MEDALYRGNREPTLDQILAEPIIQTIMRRDGTTAKSIRELLRCVSRGAKPPEPPKLRFLSAAPPVSREPPQASAGVLAQAAAPHWPRVFPGL